MKRNRMKRALVALAVLVLTGAVLSVGALIVPSVQAVIVPPGATLPPDVFVGPPGVILATTGVVPFATSNGSVSGTYVASVVSDPTNPLCAGCLDFVYQVHNNPTSLDPIGRITASSISGPSGSFVGFVTDVGFSTSAGPLGLGTVIPTTVDRSLSGDTVGFNFPSGTLALGATTDPLVIKTNATSFDGGSVNMIDGGTATVTGFAPTRAVPEPATLLLIGGGLVGLCAVARRRHQK